MTNLDPSPRMLSVLCSAALLLLCPSCDQDGDGMATENHATPADQTSVEDHQHLEVDDRHFLHGLGEAKSATVHELRSAVSVLMVMGEAEPHPYREILFELSMLGTDEAASLALELSTNPQLVFPTKDEAFDEVFTTLLASDGVVERRADLERRLDG